MDLIDNTERRNCFIREGTGRSAYLFPDRSLADQRSDPARENGADRQCSVLLNKALQFTGPRQFRRDPLRLWHGWRLGAPLPATKVPLRWEHAFGGSSVIANPAHAQNPQAPMYLLNAVLQQSGRVRLDRATVFAARGQSRCQACSGQPGAQNSNFSTVRLHFAVGACGEKGIRWTQPPDAENRMSGGVGGLTGATPLARPDRGRLWLFRSAPWFPVKWGAPRAAAPD